MAFFHKVFLIYDVVERELPFFLRQFGQKIRKAT
jgi:hypothetical protein